MPLAARAANAAPWSSAAISRTGPTIAGKALTTPPTRSPQRRAAIVAAPTSAGATTSSSSAWTIRRSLATGRPAPRCTAFPSATRTSVRPLNKDWLAARLDAGDSIEAIAREVGRHPTTVAHWVNKHGLQSAHAARHGPRGPIAREDLEPLVAVGMSIRQIARELDRSPTTIRHWLRHHDLRTATAQRARRDGSTAAEVMRDCPRHGWTWFRRVGAQTHYRCARCVVEAVSDRRRKVKEILVDEAGGRCAACGYNDCIGVLQFHHVDPATKKFHLGREGVTRSIERAREEARKCILLCANCRAEVELGFRLLPVTSDEAPFPG